MKITSIIWLVKTLISEHKELWLKYYILRSEKGLCMILKHRPVNVQVLFIIRTSEKRFVINNYYNGQTQRITCRTANEVIKNLYELNADTVLK